MRSGVFFLTVGKRIFFQFGVSLIRGFYVGMGNENPSLFTTVKLIINFLSLSLSLTFFIPFLIYKRKLFDEGTYIKRVFYCPCFRSGFFSSLLFRSQSNWKNTSFTEFFINILFLLQLYSNVKFLPWNWGVNNK